MKIQYLKKYFSYGYLLVYLLFFCIIPIYYADDIETGPLSQLIILTIISIIVFSYSLNKRDFLPSDNKFFFIDFDFFSKIIFSLYVLIVLVILVTAPSIPIIQAVQGASQADLILYREEFLKSRSGWETVLPYLVTVLDSAIIPYIIINSFLRKERKRFFYLIFFILYSISFLEKAYLFKIIIPLLFYLYYITKNKKLFIIGSSISIVGILTFMFSISQFDSFDVKVGESFFSIYYTPTNVFDAIIWRSFVVPVRTSYDALVFFNNEFQGNYLLGSTSNLISILTFQERVNFERMLYMTQFGGYGTGNANFCYIEDSYVNFGFLGVIFFSYVAGYFTKKTIETKNLAAISIMPFFLLQLYSASFIANFLNNGYFIFFFLIIFVRFKTAR
ncbi:O-antigen polymerase [Chryseobacterium sp.]|uniref:O-antigen polymerase n=1 Tax=Chryseobacterium sp. TaxID=1871047 RepID=UPI000ED7FBE2|nr:O-antigen polymerase [Chryseobacterium sp.]HCA07577.1 hypothetical protein [Chryseobacterium sp.]